MICAYSPTDEPETDVCLSCGLESWGCVCDPSRPLHGPQESDLERARRARLSRAELASEAGHGELV
jgi:hypothetical protein